MGLLQGLPRSATATALGDVEVAALTVEALQSLERAHHELAFHLLTGIAAKLANRLRQANAQREFFAAH